MLGRETLLSALLAEAKLGVDRKPLLRWLRSGPARILHPHVLLSGSPNAGLTNQVLTLVGACILAHLANATLVLPHLSLGGWTAQVARSEHGPATIPFIPFSTLFDYESFAKGMEQLVLIERLSAALQSSASAKRQRAFALGADRGWHLYKAAEMLVRRALSSGAGVADATIMRQIELRVLTSLRPSSLVQARAQAISAAIGLSGQYGCIHTRLERDSTHDRSRLGLNPTCLGVGATGSHVRATLRAHLSRERLPSWHLTGVTSRIKYAQC